MSYIAHIAALARLEQRVARVAPEDLASRLEEHPRVWNEARDRNARIVDAIFAAHEVVDDQRPIRPRQDMIVKPVHLAERRAHLADLREQTAWQLRKGEEALLEVDTFLAKRNEEVRAGVRIDDRLEGRLRFVHLQRGILIGPVRTAGAK